MKQEHITIWQHFRYLQQKYVSSTSAHQVNIRAALYRHYTKIKEEECDLSKMNINELFRECNPTSPITATSQLTPVSPESPHSVSIPSTAFLSTDDVTSQAGAVRSKSSPRESSLITRMDTAQYNRNLKNLHGVAKIMQLIEETRKELWKNMTDSFVRFRSTEVYVGYIKKVYMDKKNGISVSKDRSEIDRQSKDYSIDVGDN